jgi:two-component system phosphate regulon sensor histidine kinase PhoR
MGALFVPLVAVAVLGLVSLAGDVERGRARHADQAASLARNVAALFPRSASDLAADARALHARAGLDGALLEPTQVHATRESAADGYVREIATAEIDRWDRAGAEDLADERLAELAARRDRPNLAAWALSWTAARAARRHDVVAARSALRTIRDELQDAVDDRGLSYAIAARFELAQLDRAGPAELEALHTDLVAARGAWQDTALVALVMRIEEQLAALEPARAAAAASRRIDAARPLALVATWGTGMSEWIARGAPGELRVFDWPAGDAARPGSARIALSAERVADEWHVAALELDSIASAARARAELESWRELGFDVAIESTDGALLTGEAPALDVPSASERVPPPFSELYVRAHALDFPAFVRAERVRFRWLIALCAAALAVASVAAFATLRAVRREMQSARERESFVAAVTHELKSPLASIRLLAELLERGDVDGAKVREFGARTVAESDRLARLVDSVLRFARVGQKLRSDAFERVDARELAQRAAASVAPLAAQRGFTVRVADGAPQVLRCDVDALVGAVAELVENATKYGAASDGVDVDVEASEGRVRFNVLDRGRGVAPEDRQRIFEPFRRLGDEMTRERPGVGLGLALVQRIAQAHGGRAQCAERDGGGAHFWIEIPRGFEA